MTDLEQEGGQVVVDYFSDFSNLDLKAIVSYFHLPCTFIVPQEVFVFPSASEVEGFWGPRFADLKAQRFGHTERAAGNVRALNDDTAIASSLAVRYSEDGVELERRGRNVHPEKKRRRMEDSFVGPSLARQRHPVELINRSRPKKWSDRKEGDTWTTE